MCGFSFHSGFAIKIVATSDKEEQTAYDNNGSNKTHGNRLRVNSAKMDILGECAPTKAKAGEPSHSAQSERETVQMRRMKVVDRNK